MLDPHDWPQYLLLLAWGVSLISGTPGWAANAPLILTDAQERYTVGLFLDILEDPEKSWTITQVMSAELQPRFTASTQENPNFGATTSAYWVRLRIVNQTRAIAAWRLELSAPLIRYLDLYLPQAERGAVEARHTGALRPVASRDLFSRDFVFLLDLPPGAQQEIYLRMETNWAFFPLTLWSARAFEGKMQRESLIFGLVYGAFLVMMAYNLILWAVLCDRTYLYFVAFLLSESLFKSTLDGLGPLYLWQDRYTISQWAYALFLSLVFLSSLQFARALLLTKTSAPQAHRVIRLCLLGWGVILAGFPFLPFGTTLLLLHAFGVVNIAILFVTAVRIWRIGFRPARYYLLGWCTVFLSGLRGLFLLWGARIDYNQIELTLSIAMIFPMVFFSLALADRITHFKQEREQAQAEALRLAQEHEQFVREQNLRLEDEVRKRTAQLEAEISERKRAEVALQQMNAQLEQRVTERTTELARAKETAEIANLAKSNFLSSMSHELRTPLNHILGFTQILAPQLTEKMTDKQKKYCQYIIEGGEHLLELIDDVLDLSRVDLGEMVLAPKEILLRPLLEQSLTAIRQKDLKPRLTMTLQIPRECEDLSIVADERKFKQILFNLLSNAVKFTPDGGVIVVEVARQAENVIISVRDTGIGITVEEQTKIFEPFYQIQSGLRDKTPGAGLGLTLAKRLTELHGGRIWVESDGLDQGSCFHVELPIRSIS